MEKEKQIKIIEQLIEGIEELAGEYQDGWDEIISDGNLLLKALRQPDVIKSVCECSPKNNSWRMDNGVRTCMRCDKPDFLLCVLK